MNITLKTQHEICYQDIGELLAKCSEQEFVEIFKSLCKFSDGREEKRIKLIAKCFYDDCAWTAVHTPKEFIKRLNELIKFYEEKAKAEKD